MKRNALKTAAAIVTIAAAVTALWAGGGWAVDQIGQWKWVRQHRPDVEAIPAVLESQKKTELMMVENAQAHTEIRERLSRMEGKIDIIIRERTVAER